MVKILCFGDSNTYGLIPGGSGRYDENTRYPGVLAKLLGHEFTVCEDGLCGRTTVFDKDDTPGRRGLDSIVKSVRDHDPDILVLMLGTNDCKAQFDADENDIAEGISLLAKTAQAVKDSMKTILVSPIYIEEEAFLFVHYYNQKSLVVSKKLGKTYKDTAIKNGYFFLDAALVAAADPADGEHLNAAGHKALAKAICKLIQNLQNSLY